jgi:hypothetical protein
MDNPSGNNSRGHQKSSVSSSRGVFNTLWQVGAGTNDSPLTVLSRALITTSGNISQRMAHHVQRENLLRISLKTFDK